MIRIFLVLRSGKFDSDTELEGRADGRTGGKLWTYDAVEPGQYGAETVVAINAGNIAGYAQVALNDDPQYRGAGASLAMPTMVLAYAPLLREEIAEANGFIAQEQSKTARRQTPFAKCEIRWRQPVCDGDTITGTRGVLEKYERRGSRFVTFRVGGVNQRGETAVEYDYTCIFDYAGGPAGGRRLHPALRQAQGHGRRYGSGQTALSLDSPAPPEAPEPVEGRGGRGCCWTTIRRWRVRRWPS